MPGKLHAAQGLRARLAHVSTAFRVAPQVVREIWVEPARGPGTRRAPAPRMDDELRSDAPVSGAGSTFILGLHILMWTTLSLGVLALMVVVLLTHW